ncbi:MAG: alpha-2-macroglobulin, partial [Sediminibacterium sp.]|nr:alpha-2-macroglobulin [Sediminibacterium sp.]
MALRNVYLAAFLLLPCMMMAQDTDTAFRKEWIAIDTLIVKNDLTRTALEKVNALQLRARQNRLPGQVIKALIYRYTLEDRITTNDPAHGINSIRAEITASKDETQTAILHALLAKQYRKYYNNHRYLLYSRKNTQGLVKDDLTTWGNDDFIAAISNSFLRSLAGARILQQTNIQAYDAVILKGNQRNLRPTLFDLLAHEALDYFMSGDAYLTKPSYAFTINDPRALSTMDIFIRSDFPTKDSSSQQWQALNLFRQLLAFHRNDPSQDALLDVDLKRIQWVYGHALFPGKETAYVETLQSIIDRYPAVATASQAWYLLAAKEAEKARSYAPFGDTSGRYGYVKARQLIEKALPLFTENSLGKANMQNLLTEIHTKQLSIQTERVNIPYKPFRALVAFRNTDTLFMRIIQISNNDSIRTNSGDPDYWQKISRLTPYRSITQPLPVNNDQQLHSTEIKIESLPVGEYALFCSSGGKFSATENKMCIQFLYVSGISYVKNRNDYFVLNRESGKPMADVKVTVLKQQYISRLRKFIDDTVSTKTTNKNGYFRFEANNGGTFHYLFTTETDRLNLRDNDYSYADYTEPEETEAVSNQFEKNSNRVFFFTDRSIYRPGQSVFFKGIAVTRDYKTKLSRIITAKDSSWIYLRDVNGKTVDSLKIGLNSYGSFSGKFQLPQNVLTGNFSIEARRYNRSATFISVEEYKRPKFTVQFEKVTGAYRLNDIIVITGTAKAYAGNAIDGAKVSYNVTRNTRYMIPWYWRRPIPQGAARQIDHGEVITDAEGKFTIRFKALAEDIADHSGNPLFDFSVQADVTDAGGETHSTTAHVSAGFTALLLQVNTPPVNATDSTQKISILTTNLANEKQPAKVQVKIFALQSPGRLVRKRYWNRPDQFVMTEKEFIRAFPTDEYREESNYLSWETGKQVLEGNIDTKTQDTFAIAPGALQPGYYKIEAITTDQYGVEVKQVGYLQLFDQKNNKLPVPAYKFNYAISNTAEPGQTASFLVGSSAGDVFVISKTERPRQKASGYNFEYRSAGLKKISFTPEEADRGGININEVYVYDNRIYTTQYTVAVPWTNKSLQVSYASYRDKAEPGSAENWTVTVQGSKGEQTAAELLTGMYDASLDQFKAHNWSIPPVWETNPANSIFTGYTNFAASNYAMENYLPEKYTEQPAIEYDQLASEGWQLWTRDLKAWSSQTNFPLSPSLKEAIAGLDQSAMMDATSTASMIGGVRNGSIQITGAAAPMAQNQAMRKTDLTIEAGLFKETLNDATAQVPGIAPATGPDVVIRKNFNETAFFFPQLYADSTGKYSFSFTLPEALTQWKWMTLAHTKDLAFGSNSTTIVTQKKLMVQTNAPRFLREGDNMEFSSKIVNLSGKEITGQVTLELVDATTNTSVDGWFQNVFPAQYFTVAAGQSSAVKFPIQIPFSFNRPLTWRVIAKTAEFSDGEENSLPVLTNRALVTESLPLFLQNDTTQHVRFEKLLNTTSETLTHESITVEYTSNPIWYAVQALPYLMEYPYECAEQTFNRLYANTLASYIVNRHPRIKQVLDQWRSDTSALKSNLQKNEALKQLLLEETPWVIQAENEAQQKKNLALLFDLVKLSSQADASLEKLRQAQLPNGS